MGLVRRNVQIDYESLKGLLPWNIVPCDIDGVIEFKNHFLWIETKFGKVDLSTGQRKMLQALSKIDNCIVVVVSVDEKETQVPGVYEFAPNSWRFISEGKIGDWSSCNLDKFKKFLMDWFETVKEK